MLARRASSPTSSTRVHTLSLKDSQASSADLLCRQHSGSRPTLAMARQQTQALATQRQPPRQRLTLRTPRRLQPTLLPRPRW